MRNKLINLSVKPTILVVVTVAFLLSLGGLSYVYASLVDNDNNSNDFQIGEVKGEITEKFDPPTEENPIKPGDKYQKEVKISNTSNLPFFVRVVVTPEILSADNELLPSEFGKQLLTEINSEWLLGEDGFYYYLGTVEPDKDTDILFKSIIINEDLIDNYSSKYKNASLKISIKSETISSSTDYYRSVWWDGKEPSEKNLKTIDTKLQAVLKK